MWPTERVFIFAGAVVLAGGVIGVLFAAVTLAIEQLGIPSGPSLALLAVVAVSGHAIGVSVGLSAAVGVVVALVAVRRIGTLALRYRAVIVGFSAAATSCVGAFLIFGHPFVLNWGWVVVVTVTIVVIGVTLATGICERQARLSA